LPTLQGIPRPAQNVPQRYNTTPKPSKEATAMSERRGYTSFHEMKYHFTLRKESIMNTLNSLLVIFSVLAAIFVPQFLVLYFTPRRDEPSDAHDFDYR
jgi:hypothetical protein